MIKIENIGIFCLLTLLTGNNLIPKIKPVEKPLSFEVVFDTVMAGYTDTACWFGPWAGIIPEKSRSIVLTLQKHLRGRSDVFTPLVSMFSNDSGKSWSAPEDKGNAFSFHNEPGGVIVGVCNFIPKWHTKTKTLLGTGHSVRYRDKTLTSGRRSTVWSVYDPKTHEWSKWASLKMPDDSTFYNSGAGADQVVDLPDGDVLIPVYFKAKEATRYSVTVVKCSFDGKNLIYKENGDVLNLDIVRGLAEPSLAFYKGKYYLTLRNDENGYVAVSGDGLHFGPMKIWHFDDGTEVGSYNTQQHWVTHSDGLFLVYTRKGADNDNVARHRAPLFIARVDTERMVLLRNTEKIVVPNKGARLGNFGVVNISQNETWITRHRRGR